MADITAGIMGDTTMEDIMADSTMAGTIMDSTMAPGHRSLAAY